MKFRRSIVIATLSLACLGVGGATAAFASGGDSSAGTTTSDSDQAAQDAACAKAGIPTSADNINYDEATGVCSIDSDNNQDGGE